MNPHAEFIQTIYDDPDDDTPRLVYVDWLEENGFVLLAEFIRVQIELACIGCEPTQFLALHNDAGEVEPFGSTSDQKHALLKRETELFEKRISWRRLPPKWTDHDIGSYHRGLLLDWKGSIGDFLKYGEEIWSYGPVASLFVIGNDTELEALAESQLLARIKSLSIRLKGHLDHGGMALASSEFSANLKYIHIYGLGKRVSPRARTELTNRFGSAL